ncbi:MAG: type II secretion system F family protein [Patescibacteria group bacterium]|nr:type II secretion system F family protein [Patescibacteria group bacterium]MDD5715431.1 type II secretion system F family protein [Patescibacteria group bacterium]
MAEYSYKARNPGGDLISGVVVAPSENIAYGILRDKQLFIVSLKEHHALPFLKGFQVGSRVKPKDIVVFARQISVMMTSNVPLVRALKVLARQTQNKQFERIISDVADEVDGGAKLSQALGKYPKEFGNFFIQMVRSAETTGRLDEILDYLADQQEKDYDMRGKAKGAMIYPAFIFCALLGVGVMMVIFVLPQITEILTAGGVALPLPTKILIGFSDVIRNYWWIISAIVAGCVVGFRSYKKTAAGQHVIDKMKIRVPIVGAIFTRMYLARFARSLSTLLTSGVPLTRSLDIVADVIGNTIYQDLTKATIRVVEGGSSITTLFMKSKDVPLMLSQMMVVGEQSGQLDRILMKVADFYTRELENSLKNLTALIEPVIMVILGIAVGFLVTAIILPIYNLSGAI